MEHDDEHPFYGLNIIRSNEQAYINKLLSKYKKEAVTEELQKRIWDELQTAKCEGIITIPFKVVMRRDTTGKYPDYIDVILDTKV